MEKEEKNNAKDEDLKEKEEQTTNEEQKEEVEKAVISEEKKEEKGQVATKEEVKEQIETKKDDQPKEQEFKKAEVKTKKKHIKLIISIAVIAVAIIAALGWWFFFRTKTIDLADCLTVKYEGYSGHAKATVTLDEKAVKSKISDRDVAKRLIKKAEIELKNNENLSNGDELSVKVKISSSFLEENKLKLKDTTIKLKVEGVEEAASIDMSKYINLEYTGPNKHATAKATINKEKLEEDFGEETALKLIGRVNLNIVKNENLTNGNEVEIRVDVNKYYLEEMGINITSDVAKVKVDGLKDATEIDAFKDIAIDVTGMSPNINISISNKSEDECLKTVQYKASKTSGIANGETITITAYSWDEKLFDEKGVALKATTMEYTANGQAAYIFSLSEINDAVKTELKSIFVSKVNSKANENYSSYSDNLKWYVKRNTDYQYLDVDDVDRDISVGAPEVMSMYLLTKKPDTRSNTINTIIGIVKVPCTSTKNGVTYNWYVTVKAENASLKTDGGISENTEYTITVQAGKDEESAYQEFVNSKKDSYNVEKISL